MRQMQKTIRGVPGNFRPCGHILQVLQRSRPEVDVALLLPSEGERLVCHRLQREEGPGRGKEERGPRSGKKSTPVRNQVRITFFTKPPSLIPCRSPLP